MQFDHQGLKVIIKKAKLQPSREVAWHRAKRKQKGGGYFLSQENEAHTSMCRIFLKNKDLC